jgi:5'-phosphate synthase pdxT subunit
MIGVLALQGDFEAHVAALRRVGAEARCVREPADLAGLDGLVLPGGESGAHLRLLAASGLEAAIPAFHARGGALFGTCAGAILLARRVSGPEQRSFGLIDVDIVRNAYGRQLASFEGEPDAQDAASPEGGANPLPRAAGEGWGGGANPLPRAAGEGWGEGANPLPRAAGEGWGGGKLVFIRAPRITRTGPAVEVLMRCNGDPVLAREGRVLVATFHPELTGNGSVHRFFVEEVARTPVSQRAGSR